MFLKRKLIREIEKQEELVQYLKAKVFDEPDGVLFYKDGIEEAKERIKTLKIILNALY